MKRAALIVLSLVAACADEMPRDVQEATTPVARPGVTAGDSGAAQDTGLAQDDASSALAAPVTPIPPGGYVAWIADLRGEIPSIVEQAEQDRGQALDALQLLYGARQEPLRRHFGVGGSMVASAAMADAIARADAYMRELMRQLAATDVSAERISETASAVRQALAEVEAEGIAAGLSPDAPRG